MARFVSESVRIDKGMNRLQRPQLLAALRGALERCESVVAAWEGGSEAFDRVDELSDVDVVAVVQDDSVETTFEFVETELRSVSPIELRYDVPLAEGYSQKFYRLRDAGEFLVVDLVLIRRGDPLLFREVELHGHGRVWVDREATLVEVHIDVEKDTALAISRIPVLATAFAMFQHLAVKERLRGNQVNAFIFYESFTWRPLIEAVRLLHCPQKRGFGTRYLERDLPIDVYSRVAALAPVTDLVELGIRQHLARRFFDRCVEKLNELGPGSGVPDA